MKSIYYKISLAFLVLTLVVGCRKESDVEGFANPNSRVCKTYSQQFETVWQGMDQGYVFWGRDTVDWDERYAQYKPIFEEFDTRPNKVSYPEYAAAWEGLFEGLLDHHLMGIFHTPHGHMTAYVSPGKNDYSHTSYPARELQAEIELLQQRSDLVKYLGCDAADYGQVNIPGTYFALIKGKKAGELIAYFRFTNFYLSNIYQYRDALPNAYTAQAPLKAFYGPRYWEGAMNDACYINNDSVVGIIMDLRGNGGGSTGDLAPFIASLSQGRNVVGYTRVKDGFGRLDYSPWSPYTINAPSRHMLKEKPIVVLADINSVSCAELATMLIKNLPNGTFIGERTYGAIGALLPQSHRSHDMFYSGCMGDYDLFDLGPEMFQYKDFFPYYVYTSTFHMVDANYNDIEGHGVQPDYEIPFNHDRIFGTNKKDIQLENAIYFIKNGKIIGG